MPQETRVPQSGCWTLASKKDPRWNRRGQYSSMETDLSLGATPPEAQASLEERKAELREDPPDDLRCVWIPYPTSKLRNLFETNIFVAIEKQGTYSFLTEEAGLTQLNIDLIQGELSFSKSGGPPTHRFPAQFIGLLAREHAYWQWGWIAQERGSMSPAVLKSVLAIQDFGRRYDVPELVNSEVPLGRHDDRPWFDADYMAAVACHLCDAEFYVAMPTAETPDLIMFWVVKAPRILPKPSNEFLRMGAVIKAAINQSADALRGSDGRASVRTYAAWKNFTVSEGPDHRMRVEAPGGAYIFIDFEPTGGVYGIEFPPSPAPGSQKTPWFKRLLP
jgi:hypothetical protein